MRVSQASQGKGQWPLQDAWYHIKVSLAITGELCVNDYTDLGPLREVSLTEWDRAGNTTAIELGLAVTTPQEV